VVGFVVSMVLHLLRVLWPMAVIAMLWRVFVRREGFGVGEFVYCVLVWPFRLARAILRGGWREWRRSRYRHVKIRQPRRRRAWLARAAERIAAHEARPLGPLYGAEQPDPAYLAMQEDLRILQRMNRRRWWRRGQYF
jgi:hypothetical protein